MIHMTSVQFLTKKKKQYRIPFLGRLAYRLKILKWSYTFILKTVIAYIKQNGQLTWLKLEISVASVAKVYHRV